MKIEKQVCSLEQSKRLVGLGIECNSFFMWHIGGITGEWIVIDSVNSNITNEDLPAFTAAELIKMNGDNFGIDISVLKDKKGKFYMQTGGFGKENDAEFTYYNCFSEASAAKLINALENEWLSVEACNERLLE